MRSDPTEGSPFLRKVLDTYNGRSVDAFDSLLSDDCTLVRDGVEARGREAIKRVLAQLYRAIPDLEYRIDDAVSSGDKTAIRWEGRGAHRGEYLGVPPTGKVMSYFGITFFETRDGRIVRLWVSTNLVERLRNLAEVGQPKRSEPDAPRAPY